MTMSNDHGLHEAFIKLEFLTTLIFRFMLAAVLLGACCIVAQVQAKTTLVMLGTGTPVPDATRAGASVAVIYNDQAYIFDVGAGMVKRCMQAWQQKGIESLNPTKISYVFITHLHSDHILDYPDLASTYWWHRDSQIDVYGPVGIEKMAQGYYQFLASSVYTRVHGKQPVKNPTFYQTIQHEYDKGGWLMTDNEVTIEAFDVPHGDMRPAFGYKITTPDKTIVISGDTAKSEKLIEMARGVDILVHETINEAGLSKLSDFWQEYHSSYHTRTSELVEIANQTKPKLLVLTHVLHYSVPIETTLSEVQQGYKGKVVLANDLDIFE